MDLLVRTITVKTSRTRGVSLRSLLRYVGAPRSLHLLAVSKVQCCGAPMQERVPARGEPSTGFALARGEQSTRRMYRIYLLSMS